MLTKTCASKNMFMNNQKFQPQDKSIVINKPKIIEILDEIKASESIVDLRESTNALKENLESFKTDQVGVLNISSNGDTITINQKNLFVQLDQIIESGTIDRAIYYIERLQKSLTTIKTGKNNDINLNRWQEYEDILTDSLWVINRRDNSGVHTSGYWGNFIPQIPNQMLKRYTKKGDWVLDTFLGSGTTLIECQRLGRNGIGIELQNEVAKKAESLILSEPNKHGVILDIVKGDSRTIDYYGILEKHKIRKVQFLIMHPPYHDIIKFSTDPQDLSNAASVDEFIKMLSEVVEKASAFLEKGRYFALVIGDKYSKGEWIPLGFLAMNEILHKGFSLKSIIVKNFEETFGKRNQKELWRYRALVGGFYIFKHEYIFLFKKK